MRLDRRDALRMGFLSVLAGAVGASLPRRAFALPSLGDPSKKVLFVFLRGGNDALNTCVPIGPDADTSGVKAQYQALRNTLELTYDPSTNLNDFCMLHPSMSLLMPVFASGDLALIHRIGRNGATMSHFDDMKFLETLDAINAFAAEEGFTNKVAAVANLATPQSPFVVGSVSGTIMDMHQTSVVSGVGAHIPEIEAGEFSSGYKLHDAADPVQRKWRDALFDSYGNATLQGDFDELLKKNGEVMITSEDVVVGSAATVVEPGNTEYPDTPFGKALSDAMRLLQIQSGGPTIAGVELGGFDLHGFALAPHAALLGELAQGLRAIHDDTPEDLDLVTVVFSEFGRTAAENGSLGTDHGDGGLAFLMGSKVKGGVFNCDGTNWLAGSNGPLNGDPDYLPYVTDFRAMMREIFDKRWGVTDPGELETIMPGYGAALGDHPDKFPTPAQGFDILDY